MSSGPTTIVRRLRRRGIVQRRRPDPPSRIGRGPHGVSTAAVVRRLVDVLRARAHSRRR